MDAVRQARDRFGLFAGYDETSIASELAAPVPAGPLARRLVGLKANIACKGAPWTAGLGFLKERRAKADAGLVTRLRAAGARILPGLNMDAAALGGTSENPDYGAVRNPRDPEYSVGGSSGGSAAAVAAGLLDMAIGTDTLGSIRIPASYSGVWGLKPTYGLVGRSGITPLARGLDCAGPLARHPADLMTILRIIAGTDPDDPDARPPPDDWWTSDPPGPVHGLRIGVPDCLSTVGTDPGAQAAFTAACTRFERAGAAVVPVTMPGWHPQRLRKAALLLTECEGARAFAAELDANAPFPPVAEAMLRFGKSVAPGKLTDALAEIGAVTAQALRTLTEVDVIATPTTPQTATRLGAPPPANQAEFTALASAAGLPAIAAPVNPGTEPRPASIQLIGAPWSEAGLVSLAMVLHPGEGP